MITYGLVIRSPVRQRLPRRVAAICIAMMLVISTGIIFASQAGASDLLGADGQTLADEAETWLAAGGELGNDATAVSLSTAGLGPAAAVVALGVTLIAEVYDAVNGCYSVVPNPGESPCSNTNDTVAIELGNASTSVLDSFVEACAGKINDNGDFPPWTDPAFSEEGSTINAYSNWYDFNNTSYGPFLWTDGSTLPCDYAEVFPMMYQASQVAAEPWELQFCTDAAVWDGGGYWAPATTAAASGTDWGWATQDELNWMQIACPLPWLENLPGFNTGDVAQGDTTTSSETTAGSATRWDSSNSACNISLLADGDIADVATNYTWWGYYNPHTGTNGDWAVYDLVCSGPSTTDPLTEPDTFSTTDFDPTAGDSLTDAENDDGETYNNLGSSDPCPTTTDGANETDGATFPQDGYTCTVANNTSTGSTWTISYIQLWVLYSPATISDFPADSDQASYIWAGDDLAPLTWTTPGVEPSAPDVTTSTSPTHSPATSDGTPVPNAVPSGQTIPTSVIPPAADFVDPTATTTTTPEEGGDPATGQTADQGCSWYDPLCWLEKAFEPSQDALQNLDNATSNNWAVQWGTDFEDLGDLALSILGIANADEANYDGCTTDVNPITVVDNSLTYTEDGAGPFTLACWGTYSVVHSTETNSDGIIPVIKITITAGIVLLTAIGLIRYATKLFGSGH